MAEKNPLCPDQGGHHPHTVFVEVHDGTAVVSNRNGGPVGRRPVELPDGKYVTACDGWKPEPIMAVTGDVRALMAKAWREGRGDDGGVNPYAAEPIPFAGQAS